MRVESHPADRSWLDGDNDVLTDRLRIANATTFRLYAKNARSWSFNAN